MVDMKTNNTVKTLIAAVIMAMVVSASLVMAQSTDDKRAGKRGQRGARAFSGERGGHGMSGRMFRNLDLTDEQQAKLKQIRASHSESTKALRQQIRTQMQTLRQANQSGAFDEALVSQKLAQVAPLRAKLMAEEYKIRQEMLSILTPEQKTKLEQSREEFKAKRGERKARKS
jgi:periplasmic protein CpxP/Spy